MRNIPVYFFLASIALSCSKKSKEEHVAPVAPQTPLAASVKTIYYNYPLYQALPVSFESDANGATNYLWQFGDGETSTQPSPGHTYMGFGKYIVKLTVNDSLTVSEEIYVNRSPTYSSMLNGARTWHRWYGKGYVPAGIDSAVYLGDTVFSISYINPFAISIDGDTLTSVIGYSNELTFRYVPPTTLLKPFYAKLLHLKRGSVDSIDYTIYLAGSDKVERYTYP